MKQTDNWRKDRLNPFLERIRKGLDISTYDSEYLAKQESKYGPYGIKMTEEDRVYRDDQVSGLREMYCQSFADKRWLVNVERGKKEELSQFIAKERESVDQAKLFTKVAIPDDMEGVEQEEIEQEPMDTDYVMEEEEENNNSNKKTKKRRKSGEKEKMTMSFADMPRDCQHIRHSINKVRAEYYNTVDELMSVYHMSYDQAISAVVTVGKRMFGLVWRMFEEGDTITIDTVPGKKE